MKLLKSSKRVLKNILLYPPVYFAILYEKAAALALPRIDGMVRGRVIDTLSASVRSTSHGGIGLNFFCPNDLTVFRTRSFSHKEPETLRWIDGFPEGSVFWDIGANVGIYSIYAAKRHPKLSVYAFEPSILNLELLGRNIALNEVERQVCLVPLPLSDCTGQNQFILSTLDRGGALSAFGVDYGHDGKAMSARLSYGTLGVSLDDLVGKFALPAPNFIKIDVDGIEHVILRGGQTILSDPGVQSILVEINDDFVQQHDEADALLRQFGFVLSEKRRTDLIDAGSKFARTYNNIWSRVHTIQGPRDAKLDATENTTR